MHRGLIGLLLDYLKQIHLIHSQKEFLPILFLNEFYNVHDSTLAAIVLYDFFPGTEKDTLNNLFQNSQKEYIHALDLFFAPLSDAQKKELNSFLNSTLLLVQKYAKRRKPISSETNDWGLYDVDIKKQLSCYYDQKVNSSLTLSYNVYLYIYLAVNKQLPPFFSFGQKYHADLKEFNDVVLCEYGVLSVPGKRAIMELAFKPDGSSNIFALCEYADMLFYGDTIMGVPNYSEAIRMYEYAAGIKKTDGLETACHPLALFSLSYIFFNYHRRGFMENIPAIDYLEQYTDSQRVELATKYADLSSTFIKTGASLNMLGVIAKFLSDSERKRLNLFEARYYFEKAADLNYVYAYNNLATLESNLIDSDPTNANTHLNHYLSYLSQSAKMHEPWGANWLGLFYLKGIVSGSKMTFTNKINKSFAKTYFLMATEYHIDRNSAWAVANLMVYFPEYYHNFRHMLPQHIEILVSKGAKDTLTFIKEKCNIDIFSVMSEQFTHQHTLHKHLNDALQKYIDVSVSTTK